MTHLPAILLSLWLIGALILLLRSLGLTDGRLIYTLDDPYISLAVAENILHGGYGINPDEYSSPSSSIVYPWLLAITEWLGFGSWGPLIFNIPVMAAAVYVLGLILRDHVLIDRVFTPRRSFGFHIALGLGLCLTMNAWGLVALGMEHSLHVFAVLFVLFQLARRIDTGVPRVTWLTVAITALPLIRFEGLALSIVSIVALGYLGQRRAAFTAATLVILAPLSWLVFTHMTGLPVLPSSVLVKSEIAAKVVGHGTVEQILTAVHDNLVRSLAKRQGRFLLLLLLILAGLGIVAMTKKDRRTMTLVICGTGFGTGIGHVFFGSYGWFARYEVYALSYVALSCVILARPYLCKPLVGWLTAISLVWITLPYSKAALKSPRASLGIYQQHYQMHRFVTEHWRRPVAVNDIGWVSYHNPHFVLDLGGLGSEEVRLISRSGHPLDKLQAEQLLAARQVELLMIYDKYLQKIVPDSWVKIASLETLRVTAAGATVSFYAAPTVDSKILKEKLLAFSKTMPTGAALRIEQELQIPDS